VYINRVELTNIRQFRHLDISFTGESGNPLTWSLFVGDNATGKTTLLRSIALGLCDETSAAGLVRELTGSLIRKGSKTRGIIRIELVDLVRKSWTLQTTIEPLTRTGDMVRQDVFRGTIDAIKSRKSKGEKNRRSNVKLSRFPWQALFVVGYGAGRDPEGGEEYERYRNVDAVYTLFRYDQPLQSPELGWRRLLDAARKKSKGKEQEKAAKIEDDRIRELLHHVLVLENGEELELTPMGIQVNGVGYSTPLSSHADGYKATTTWVLDLIAWRMLFNRGLMPETMTGIVLIDEIEQHLHPSWQRYIISRLHQQFPKLQFIATTHSPLCTAGTGDLTEEDCQLIALSRGRGTVEPEFLSLPRGLRADQILTSDAFDLEDTRNPEIGEKVAQFRELSYRSRLSQSERRKLNKLRRFINERVPEAAQFEEERKLRDDLRHLIKELHSQKQTRRKSR
jgi:predicted ATP-binding protein involved in virulence